MIAPTIEAWLRKKAYEEAGINAIAAVGSFFLGAVVLAAAIALTYLFSALLYSGMVDSDIAVGGKLVSWLGFQGLWAIVSGGFLAILFAGNYRATRRYWQQIHARRPGSSATMSGAGPMLFEIGLTDELLFSGPRLIVTGAEFCNQAWRWLRMDFSECARVLARIVELNSRISYDEIWQLLPRAKRGRLIAQLRNIDGVVVLRSDPPGLTLTAELRAELQRRSGFRGNYRSKANRGERRGGRQGQQSNRQSKQGSYSRRQQRSSAGRSGVDQEWLRACRVLGVSPDADEAAIKEAYRSLMKRYHPDRVRDLPSDSQDEAEERAKRIIKAYQILVKRKVSSL